MRTCTHALALPNKKIARDFLDEIRAQLADWDIETLYDDVYDAERDFKKLDPTALARSFAILQRDFGLVYLNFGLAQTEPRLEFSIHYNFLQMFTFEYMAYLKVAEFFDQEFNETTQAQLEATQTMLARISLKTVDEKWVFRIESGQ